MYSSHANNNCYFVRQFLVHYTLEIAIIVLKLSYLNLNHFCTVLLKICLHLQAKFNYYSYTINLCFFIVARWYQKFTFLGSNTINCDVSNFNNSFVWASLFNIFFLLLRNSFAINHCKEVYNNDDVGLCGFFIPNNGILHFNFYIELMKNESNEQAMIFWRFLLVKTTQKYILERFSINSVHFYFLVKL